MRDESGAGAPDTDLRSRWRHVIARREAKTCAADLSAEAVAKAEAGRRSKQSPLMRSPRFARDDTIGYDHLERTFV